MAARITRIAHIRGYRSFRAFTWPTDLLPFSRFNLIYGWNGSGKTALSGLFSRLQAAEPLDPSEGEVEFMIAGHSVDGRDFGTATVPPIRVFNRDTVDRTVFEQPARELPAVYYLGEESVEKQKQVVGLKARLSNELDKATQLETAVGRNRQAYEKFCTDTARAIRDMLTTSGGGPYRNYQAPSFKASANGMTSEETKEARLSEADRQRFLGMKDGISRGELELLDTDYPDIDELDRTARGALAWSVASETIPELVADPVVAAWVGEGVALHTGSRVTDKCRFCDQPIPASRLKQLKAHHNDELGELLRDLDARIGVLGHAESIVQSVIGPDVRLMYPHLVAECTPANGSLAARRDQDLARLRALKSALLAKWADPLRVFEGPELGKASTATNGDLWPTEEQDAGLVDGLVETKALIAQVNAHISSHNNYSRTFERQTAAARTALERDCVSRVMAEYRSKASAMAAAEEGLRAARSAAASIRTEIATLERSIGQIQKPADELNAEMATYLGRDELRFVPGTTGYTITRNGEPALNLSEGERSAIAFMYFLKSLQDMKFDSGSGIVVIDDPVSSLDANSLFSAFGLMRDRTADTYQLFVLTHDFAFFRLVKSWFLHLRSDKKGQYALYMLEAPVSGGQRCSGLKALDQLLRDYESEYHYLFKLVYEAAKRANEPDTLAECYPAPNVARRLLEAFLAFRFPQVKGENMFGKRLEQLAFADDGEKHRIERFLQMGSHLDHIAGPEHDMSVLSSAREVLSEILQCMERTDHVHYTGMVEALSLGAIDGIGP
jgi:wobble nucleotide-excising tRNase